MYFQKKLTLREMTLRDKIPLEFKLTKPTCATVLLHPYTGKEGDSVICVVTLEHEPSAKVKQLFETIESEDDKAKESVVAPAKVTVSARGFSRGNFATSGHDFPEPLLSYSGHINKLLAETARRTITCLRWRTNAFSAQDPFKLWTNAKWSMDGKRWHPLPTPIAMFSEVKLDLRPNAAIISEVIEMVEDDLDEPLGHSLFREAWAQKFENPRSSLILGMTAAEVGLKNFIGEAVKDADWLINQLPTPPIVRIITEYLPHLTSKAIGSPKIAIPRVVVDLLRDGVTIRNEIVHRGRDIAFEKFLDILSAVHDFLRILDFHRGHVWALRHITSETISELPELASIASALPDEYTGKIPVTAQMVG
jgi:hypothetical protein